MELWEGAVLAVGGLWLVGYMSRKNSAHPVNFLPGNQPAGVGTADGGSGIGPGSNLTTIGAPAGGGNSTLIAGETVAPPPVARPIRPVAPISYARPITGPPPGPARPIRQYL